MDTEPNIRNKISRDKFYSGDLPAMLRGNRGFVVALVGLTAAIAFYWFIGDLSSVSSGIQSEASDRANKYGEDAQSYKQRRCVGLAPAIAEDCQHQADQTARENQRVELDLAAQQMTAWWTQIMGVAALVGMALSAVGVWLVWTTFAETKAANEIARMDQRPWLHIEIEKIGQLAYNESDLDFMIISDFVAKVSNSGKGLAHDVRLSAHVFTTADFTDATQSAYFREIPGEGFTDLRHIPPGHIQSASLTRPLRIQLEKTDETKSVVTVVAIVVGYSAPLSSKRHSTGQSFFVCAEVTSGGLMRSFTLAELCHYGDSPAGEPMGVPGAIRPRRGGVMT